MRAAGNLFAWLVASGIAYVAAAALSQLIVLNGLAELGAPVSAMVRLRSTLDAIIGTPLFLIVIGIGFALAFFVASLIKAALPVLAGIAYPVAGGAAMVAILELMRLQFEVYPILGAQEPLGYALQVLAGALGGVAFELTRPKA